MALVLGSVNFHNRRVRLAGDHAAVRRRYALRPLLAVRGLIDPLDRARILLGSNLAQVPLASFIPLLLDLRVQLVLPSRAILPRVRAVIIDHSSPPRR